MRRTLRGSSGKDARLLTKFRSLLGRMEERDRRLLLYMTRRGQVQRVVRPSVIHTSTQGKSLTAAKRSPMLSIDSQ